MTKFHILLFHRAAHTMHLLRTVCSAPWEMSLHYLGEPVLSRSRADGDVYRVVFPRTTVRNRSFCCCVGVLWSTCNFVQVRRLFTLSTHFSVAQIVATNIGIRSRGPAFCACIRSTSGPLYSIEYTVLYLVVLNLSNLMFV